MHNSDNALTRECVYLGQDALFKVSKAYAVYDSEVGYCQGLSFIAASLLLHVSLTAQVTFVVDCE